MAALEVQVIQQLQLLCSSTLSKSEAVDQFRNTQEILLNRFPRGDKNALLFVLPYIKSLYHLPNGSLMSAILSFLNQASQQNDQFLKEIYNFSTAMLLLDHSKEKNILHSIDSAQKHLQSASRHVITGKEKSETFIQDLWEDLHSHITNCAMKLGSCVGEEHAKLTLRILKYLEQVVLIYSESKLITLYRDPARSNIQPDAITLDQWNKDTSTIKVDTFTELCNFVVLSICSVLSPPKYMEIISKNLQYSYPVTNQLHSLEKRRFCVFAQSLTLIATLRPQFMSWIIPLFTALCQEDPARFSALHGATKRTIACNLLKLLALPDAQVFRDEVTECLIAFGLSERAFRAISKSKEPRRKYISAPSEASLRKAKLGKRNATEMLSEKRKKEHSSGRTLSSPKRSRTSIASTLQFTHDSIVNLPLDQVLDFTIDNFMADFVKPPKENLKLQLFPSELKAQAIALLSKIATPSSVLAVEATKTRIRKAKLPDSHDTNSDLAVVTVFDEIAAEEVADWISRNASRVAEPLVAVTDDNAVQVYLKAVTQTWCQEMAIAAFDRVLENEKSLQTSGAHQARYLLLCRLASYPFLKNIQSSTQEKDAGKPPPIYKKILDFVLDNHNARYRLADMLFYQEYVQMIRDQDKVELDQVYRACVQYFYTSLAALHVKEAEAGPANASVRKVLTQMIPQTPYITLEVVEILVNLCHQKHGIVLGITLLRDLMKERHGCANPLLQIILALACQDDETCRSTAIRCIANQLYGLERMQPIIEKYSIRMVSSLGQEAQKLDEEMDMSEDMDEEALNVESLKTQKEGAVYHLIKKTTQRSSERQQSDYQEFMRIAKSLQPRPIPSSNKESEILKRLDLHLALCAKKPSLLHCIVTAYSASSESSRKVIFHAVEKLIKHLKQKKSECEIIEYLYGFDSDALTFVCHIIQLLCHRTKPSEQLLKAILQLYHDHASITDAISVLIPILPHLLPEFLFPLLPQLLHLSPARLSVAFTRLLEVLPPYATSPFQVILALHNLDDSIEEKAASAIRLCIEQHKHAFPPDLLLSLFETLMDAESLPRITIYTMIYSVTAFPSMKESLVKLLYKLADRRIWELDAVSWKKCVECAVMLQPASFPMLLEKLPLQQLKYVLEKEPGIEQGLYKLMLDAENDKESASLCVQSDVRDYLKETLRNAHSATDAMES